MKKGIRVMYDYDGLAYTVAPCWWSEDSRVHYCGFYATSRESWRRVPELTPKESESISWEDLKAYVDDMDIAAVHREMNEP